MTKVTSITTIISLVIAIMFSVQTNASQNNAPITVPQPVNANKKTATLPANTEVLLRLNDELTTEGKWMDVGHTFRLSVVHDVLLEGYTVIPAGSIATGQVTWMTNKGIFGKSGKFDIEISHVEVNGQRIPLVGKFRQKGEGNTVATVGAVVVVPVAGFFITGRSGRMPKGRELMVYTRDDVKVQFDDSYTEQQPIVAAKKSVPVEQEQKTDSNPKNNKNR